MVWSRLGLRTNGSGVHLLAFAILSVSLTAAVLLYGGVEPGRWSWIALAISIAAGLAIADRSTAARVPRPAWGLVPLGLLFCWFLFQLTPLPPAVVMHLSPLRWSSILAARMATSQPLGEWFAVSVSPAMTMTRMLFVVPAMATFLAMRQFGMLPSLRMWWTVAPVVAIAAIEGALGVTQFLTHPGVGASGTYVNRNHFAGLLEMALPLAIMWPVAMWRRHSADPRRPPELPAMLLVFASGAAILAGLLVSFSRSGVLSALAAVGVLVLIGLAPARRRHRRQRRHRHQRRQRPHAPRYWRWAVAAALPLCLLVFFAPAGMVQRLGEAGTDATGRAEIWRDTRPLIAAYKWTGSGLGTYERGLYAFKTTAPMNTVDFAHDDYLQMLAELGVPGAMLAAMLGGWMVSRAWSAARRTHGQPNWELSVGLLGAFVALGLHGLSDFNLYIPANALTLAWLGGVAVSPALQERDRPVVTVLA